MTKQTSQKKSRKKFITTFIKILISVVLFYIVMRQISFQEVLQSIQQSNPWYLLASGFFLLLSQIVSTYRLQLYFKALKYPLAIKTNLQLYFIGMFYNFFIPGGIGGDAYKVIQLQKKMGWKAKKLTLALLADRISGLIAICVLIISISFFILPQLPLTPKTAYYFLLILVLFTTPLAAKFIVKKLFKEFKKVYLSSLLHSILVQVLQLISITFLIVNFRLTDQIWVYLLVFLISVILSVISFAGIGAREFVFLQAALILNFNEQHSIAIGLIFTLLTALISLIGLFYELKGISYQTDTTKT